MKTESILERSSRIVKTLSNRRKIDEAHPGLCP